MNEPKKSKQKKQSPAQRIAPRINPNERLCPSYDNTGISLQLEASREKMGLRVVDDCAEEHMM